MRKRRAEAGKAMKMSREKTGEWREEAGWMQKLSQTGREKEKSTTTLGVMCSISGLMVCEGVLCTHHIVKTNLPSGEKF